MNVAGGSAEEWRDVPGFDRRYAVSNLGRVRSAWFVDRRGVRHPERILSQSCGNGYWTVFPGFHGRRVALYVHRLVAEAFIPNPCELPQVNHIDGDKKNNDLSNLEWTDALGNARHARRSGLTKQKLSPADVAQIRERHAAGEIAPRIAPDFNVTPEQIRNVTSRRHFPWLP